MDDGIDDWVDAVIVPMKMASVTTYGFDDYGIDYDGVPDDVDDDVVDDGINGELRYEMLLARNRRKLEYAGAKMIISMMASVMMAWVIPSRKAWIMMLTVIVIVPMKMASVTTYDFDDYGIDHDGLRDDVDDDVIDDYIDDGIDGECKLRYDLYSLMAAELLFEYLHRHKLVQTTKCIGSESPSIVQRTIAKDRLCQYLGINSSPAFSELVHSWATADAHDVIPRNYIQTTDIIHLRLAATKQTGPTQSSRDGPLEPNSSTGPGQPLPVGSKRLVDTDEESPTESDFELDESDNETQLPKASATAWGSTKSGGSDLDQDNDSE
jgi:hypothetical protein